MHLGSREKPNLPLTPRPEKPQKQPCAGGGPASGRRCPSLAVTPHHRFSLETLSANQTTLPGSCRAAFILLPAWLCASARKNAVSHPETRSGICLRGNHGPESEPGPSGPVLPSEEAPREGRGILGFLEVSEICHMQIQTQSWRDSGVATPLG